LLSGKMDVRHEVVPTVTATRTEPKPARIPAVSSAISSPISGGSDTKCQPPSPGYRHSGAVNSNVPVRSTCRHYGRHLTGREQASGYEGKSAPAEANECAAAFLACVRPTPESRAATPGLGLGGDTRRAARQVG